METQLGLPKDEQYCYTAKQVNVELYQCLEFVVGSPKGPDLCWLEFDAPVYYPEATRSVGNYTALYDCLQSEGQPLDA